jgi:uncharacterized membrane protein
MIHGRMTGIAAMIGLPVMKNDVIGVMMDKMIPQVMPTLKPARIRHALMTGPVIKILVFLKNWLMMQIAKSTAVIVICFALIFIITLLFLTSEILDFRRVYNSILLSGQKNFPISNFILVKFALGVK